jgi:hypothetical protein
MGSGVVVDIGTFFFTPHRIQGMGRADGRNGTTAGKFETVAGFCGDVDFAAGQPGCMGISKYSPLLSFPLLTYVLHLPLHFVTCPLSLRVSNIPQLPRNRSYPE